MGICIYERECTHHTTLHSVRHSHFRQSGSMHDYFSIHLILMKMIHARIITHHSKETTEDSDSILCSIILYYPYKQFSNSKRITNV